MPDQPASTSHADTCFGAAADPMQMLSSSALRSEHEPHLLMQSDSFYFLIYHLISQEECNHGVAAAICEFRLNSANSFSHAKHEHGS